jgi:NADH:ubiquinone oxidoreductase subunit 2 (subunit N)
VIGLLNSGLASAYYLRLVFASVQRPGEETANTPVHSTPMGIAVAAALLFAAAATLVLGIVPDTILHASEAAAHTLRPPSEVRVTSPVTASARPNP